MSAKAHRARPTSANHPKSPTSATRSKLKPPATKAEIILRLLSRSGGATAADLAKATGWQAHSVRGFLSGDLKKKRGLDVVAEKVDGATRYSLARIA